MAIERWHPRFGSMQSPFREMDDLFNRFFREWPSTRMGEARGHAPALDMVDKKDEVVLRADVPGLEQKDLHVSVENGTLTIRGERKGEQEARDEDYYCCERWAGSFTRSVNLPAGVDPEKVRATFKNGVLEIHLPKSQEGRGKQIEIQKG